MMRKGLRMTDPATAEWLIHEWRQLGENSDVVPVHRRVSAATSLQLYFSVDEARRPGLMAIGCAAVPPELLKLNTLWTGLGQRPDGQFALTISLVDPKLLRVFAQLCALVVSAALSCPHGTDAVEFLARTILEWRQLLRLGDRGRLNFKEQRGLFAELVHFESHLRAGNEMAVASAWCGPRGAPQDFRFEAAWIECKSTDPQEASIQISSLEQLEDQGVALFLVVIPLIETEVGTSLSALIQRLRETLAPNPQALKHFELTLTAAGYRDSDGYSTPSYQAGRTRWYRVQEGFPRLSRTNVDTGIASARYQISLTALTPFATEDLTHGL